MTDSINLELVNQVVSVIPVNAWPLVKDGLVECIGHNEEGEPLFGLTELGKQAQKQILEEQNKKNKKKKK